MYLKANPGRPSTPEPIVFPFKNIVPSVIFVVDRQEFHCHKEVLTENTKYFETKFSSEWKEKKPRIVLKDTNPVVFKRLMEIIYKGKITDAKELFECISHYEKGKDEITFMRELWDAGNDLFALACRFQLTDVVREAFDKTFVYYYGECGEKQKCVSCAVKLLLALGYEMKVYKRIGESSRFAMEEALKRLKGNERKIELSAEALLFLFEMK